MHGAQPHALNDSTTTRCQPLHDACPIALDDSPRCPPDPWTAPPRIGASHQAPPTRPSADGHRPRGGGRQAATGQKGLRDGTRGRQAPQERSCEDPPTTPWPAAVDCHWATTPSTLRVHSQLTLTSNDRGTPPHTRNTQLHGRRRQPCDQHLQRYDPPRHHDALKHPASWTAAPTIPTDATTCRMLQTHPHGRQRGQTPTTWPTRETNVRLT